MKSTGEAYETCWAYSAAQRSINTHCHLLPEREFEGFDLDKLLRNSYLNWCGVTWGEDPASRRELFEKIQLRSAFVWLQKSLQDIYRSDLSLSAGNWEAWDELIAAAHAGPGFRQELLRQTCRYQRMILDAYWRPGSDNQDPDLFSPTFRVNGFFFGYAQTETDHDGNNPYRLYPRPFICELDEYVSWVRGHIVEKTAQGCVALKVPIAYDRGLDFKEVDRARASQAFTALTHRFAAWEVEASQSEPSIAGSLPSNAPSSGSSRSVELGLDPQLVKDFQDYLFYQVCQVAAECRLPLQVHTGSGQGRRTNALQLLEAIQKNPDTQFVLLHCSYPWVQDAVTLVSRYANTYADLSMLPLFSSQAARTVLEELIENSNSDRLAWGCDTWTPEESLGALLALRGVLANTLAHRIASGYLDQQAAEFLIENLHYRNAQQLYRLGESVGER